MEDIYNNSTYLQHNPNWHSEDSEWKANEIKQLLQVIQQPINSIAEIGCGTGEILVHLKNAISNESTRYYGFDISTQAILLAASKTEKNLHFECIDVTKRVEKELYDVILVVDVIEHLKDYFSFLESIVRKSKYTIFHIPLDMFVWSLFKEQMLLESKERVGHIHNFSEDFILSVLSDYGYEVILKKYTEPDYTSKSIKQSFVNRLKKMLFKISPRFCTKTLGGYSLMVLCENKTN